MNSVNHFSFRQFYSFSVTIFRIIATRVSVCRKNMDVAGVHQSANAARAIIAKRMQEVKWPGSLIQRALVWVPTSLMWHRIKTLVPPWERYFCFQLAESICCFFLILPSIFFFSCEQLELLVDGLPSHTKDFVCTFTTANKTIFSTNATRTPNGVNCLTPPIIFNQLQQPPSIDNPLYSPIDHFESKLALQTQNGMILASIPFTFYDCNAYTSCTQCVSSRFPCGWCVESHRCTHDTTENCRNDVIVAGVSVSRAKTFLNSIGNQSTLKLIGWMMSILFL